MQIIYPEKRRTLALQSYEDNSITKWGKNLKIHFLDIKMAKRYIHLNAQFQRIARRDKKAFLSDQCKGIKKPTDLERLEISSRKLA